MNLFVIGPFGLGFRESGHGGGFGCHYCDSEKLKDEPRVTKLDGIGVDLHFG